MVQSHHASPHTPTLVQPSRLSPTPLWLPPPHRASAQHRPPLRPAVVQPTLPHPFSPNSPPPLQPCPCCSPPLPTIMVQPLTHPPARPSAWSVPPARTHVTALTAPRAPPSGDVRLAAVAAGARGGCRERPPPHPLMILGRMRGAGIARAGERGWGRGSHPHGERRARPDTAAETLTGAMDRGGSTSPRSSVTHRGPGLSGLGAFSSSRRAWNEESWPALGFSAPHKDPWLRGPNLPWGAELLKGFLC